ncbi:MAG: methyltransferase domain-containing protein [Solirubrobacteraceae bacterium]
MTYFERLWSELPDAAPEHFELRREFMLEALAPGSKVIDVGAGAGWFAAALAGAGCSVVGVEVAQEPVRRARERFPALEFVVVPEGRLPFAAAAFDGAWLGEVLEHVADVVGLLDEVARVLAPGGRLALSTPAHGWRLRLALGVSRRAFERHFEPRADHLRFFTDATLERLLAACGFEQIAIRARSGVLLATARAPR